MNSELTLEQQFELASFKQKIEGLNVEQTKELLIDLFKSHIVKEQLYKELIGKEWGFISK